MNRRQLETRSRSNSPQEIARGSEWTREQMETRSRSRSPESTNTKSSRGKKKKYKSNCRKMIKIHLKNNHRLYIKYNAVLFC